MTRKRILTAMLFAAGLFGTLSGWLVWRFTRPSPYEAAYESIEIRQSEHDLERIVVDLPKGRSVNRQRKLLRWTGIHKGEIVGIYTEYDTSQRYPPDQGNPEFPKESLFGMAGLGCSSTTGLTRNPVLYDRTTKQFVAIQRHWEGPLDELTVYYDAEGVIEKRYLKYSPYPERNFWGQLTQIFKMLWPF